MSSKRCLTIDAFLIFCMMFFSCKSTDNDMATPLSETISAGTEHIKLTPGLAIGVELGDSNYVFGQIVEANLNENGDVLILDTSTMNVRKYSSNGEFIGSAGRQGTGPGEFQMPRGMAILGNNDFVVSDMAGGAICIFDDSLNWRENIIGFFPRPPFTVRTAGDSAFVGMLPSFNREEGLMGYSIVRMENSSEPVTVYDEQMQAFNPSRVGPLGAEEAPIFTSDNTGHVFIAAPGSDAVSITGYDQDGEVFLTIEENVERVEKNEEELVREQAEFEELSARIGSRGGRMSDVNMIFDPILYRRMVTDLGIDSRDRLWVRLGAFRYPFWNVYNFEGELLFTASMETDDPDIDDMVVRITENGATAWIPDPMTWPRVLVLEIPGTE
ncbi:MAG: hypothetical protein K8S15_00685 [Candidatus Aegiribacteria sp.]|nr:hypothetical protein [Candidatus Aegiribacteria sp.]